MEETKDQLSTTNSHDWNCDSSSSITVMDEETFTHLWIVKTFQNIWLALKEGDDLSSSDFQGGITTGHTWHMTLQKYKEKNAEYLSVFLCLTSKSNEEKDNELVMAKVQFSVMDKNDKSVRSLETNFHDFLITTNEDWGFSRFLKAEDLSDATKGYLVGDELKIQCRITVLKGVNSYSNVTDKLDTTNPFKSMSQDYRKLFESADYYDIIITSETKEFKVHKAILSARSSVFSAMFRAEMTESLNGKIILSDFSDHIIKDMLQFLYCGEVEMKKENILELLKLADKYDIKDLIEKCCQVIPSILTCENVVEALLAIPEYHLSDLKCKVINFIALNKETIKKTSAFQNMIYTDPELFKELVLVLV